MDNTRFFQNPGLTRELEQYKKETENELNRILSWWMENTVDGVHGGFIGKMDHNNTVFPNAPRGSVLNSRILWAFSATYNASHTKEHLTMAVRAFDYIVEYFIDREFGGIFWTVDFNGRPLESKKQIYALAFAVYGLSEFYKASQNEKARGIAIDIYSSILKYSHDRKFGGYVEALTRDWRQLDDQRLSAKDANEKKSMNTHLHLLEAFANLYKIWPDENLKANIIELIRIFMSQIVDPRDYHLRLFFDEQWNSRPNVISYGHDVEAAWLIEEAAELIAQDSLLNEVREISVGLAEAAAGGLDADGGLWYEYDPVRDHLAGEKHSWPQAEAMVGFFNAWQLTGEEKFLRHSLRAWQFVKNYIMDRKLGEWYWGVHEDHSPMMQEEKVGIWKCPYHNSRACLEIIQRIEGLLNTMV